jgi:hypothetical protein
MHRFHYSVTTKAARSLAWEIYTNWRLWNTFANIYGDLHWREGQPWRVGSRLQIEIVKPISTVVEHVITAVEPRQRIAWVDHSCGITLDQSVAFEDLPTGETRIHTHGEFTRSRMMIAGRTVERLISSFTETWYENFRLLCDQFAEASTHV